MAIVSAFNTIQEAVIALRAAETIIVADDKSPSSRGFMLAIAESINADTINLMATKARGLVCLALDTEIINRLELGEMSDSANPNQESFTVSIDADLKFGVTTGISAQDRATTIQVALANDVKPSDLRRPGHVFPLAAIDGGVLKRIGQAEAGTDLARLSGFKAASTVCSILRDDGELAELKDLHALANELGLRIINLADLVAYRLQTERFVHRMVDVSLPNKFSEEFRVYGYRDALTNNEHIALVLGDVETSSKPVLVRMHSACLVSDVFGSLRSDDGEQLRAAMEMIVQEGAGVLVYLRDEGRGLGIVNQLKAYKLQDEGYDTVEANAKLGLATDLRNFGVGAQILTDLGLSQIRLLTNNPKKITALEGYGLEVTECVAVNIAANKYSQAYLNSKKEKLGHRL